jgi:hypothetical protein
MLAPRPELARPSGDAVPLDVESSGSRGVKIKSNFQTYRHCQESLRPIGVRIEGSFLPELEALLRNRWEATIEILYCSKPDKCEVLKDEPLVKQHTSPGRGRIAGVA